MSNQKIVFASILGSILATGLLVLIPSIIGNAQAQMYDSQYGYDSYDSYYPQEKSSHTDIQKIKCVNSNINVNGIDITQIPQDGTATAATNEGSLEGANTQNGNILGDRINFERNLVNICVNVNDNEQLKVSPPEETTLAVTKAVTCTPDGSTAAIEACQRILGQITPDLFTIDVTGNNPNPSQFEGQFNPPVIVTLGAGNYAVLEHLPPVQVIEGVNIEIEPNFDGNCIVDPMNEQRATGTIAVGESQTCNIINHFIVNEVD